MNIFYLDDDVTTCAQYHCDKHVVKMILEYAQLLSTAHRVLDKDDVPSVLYKATHINHPSAKWVRLSMANYKWLYELFMETCREYTFRYNKRHKSELLLSSHLRLVPKNIPVAHFTEPLQAMPFEFKVPGNSLKAYRQYYRNAKKDIANWTKRPVPLFMYEV